MIFYRDLVAAALELAPRPRRARDRQGGQRLPDARHRHPDFDRKARRSLRPASTTCASTTTRSSGRCCGKWNVFELEGLDAEAEQAREQAAAYLEAIDSLATRQAERQQR